MGSVFIDKCLLTGLPAKASIDDFDCIEYTVFVEGKRFFISLPNEAYYWEQNEPFFKEKRFILQSLLYNDKWFIDEKRKLKIDDLKDIVNNSAFPISVLDKEENLKLFIEKIQNENTLNLISDSTYFRHHLWKKLYFESLNDLVESIKKLKLDYLFNTNILN